MTEVTPLGWVRALLTLALSLAFLALWVWAWRKERREDFQEAALLPLQDETARDESTAQ